MKKILWISPFAPYDNIGHASGKIENFYIKSLSQKVKNIDIRLLSFCLENEIPKIDLDRYGIKYDIISYRNDKKAKLIRNIKYNGLESKFNIFNKYANYVPNFFKKEVIKKINKYDEIENYKPDIIILEWTSSVLLIEEIKKVYPNSKYIAIEEDVAYLSYYRHINLVKSKIMKLIWTYKFKILKDIELQALEHTDIIICNNEKDKELLLKENIDEFKIMVWCPFYFDLTHIMHVNTNNNIIFYGAMAREENYLSVVWFIENVLEKLDDLKVQFLIIGSNPSKKLYAYENDKVKVIGFVQDISIYLKNSLCLVAPLVLGAGIKIKVLEAMSSGLPVLTNDIGIEGIPAISGIDYFLCQNPDDYVTAIKQLVCNKEKNEEMSKHAQKFMKENFNIDKSLHDFVSLIEKL